MKYEVIGWIDPSKHEYKAHGKKTCCVDNAIIKDIRKHKYCFGGDMHENYAPLLNDGTYVEYSWRGFGGIMAQAHNENNNNPYAYSLYYMDKLIQPNLRKYPKLYPIDERLIVPKNSIAEVFTMNLDGEIFQLMKSGIKNVEIRLFDEKRKLLDIDDYIKFHNNNNKDEFIIRRVIDIFFSKSFEFLFDFHVRFDDDTKKELHKFTPMQLGASKDTNLEGLVNMMYKYYKPEDEEKHGVIAIVLEEAEINHSC